MTKGIVNIRGKDYQTVARRVADFREVFPISDKWAIITELVVDNETRVVMLAEIIDPDGEIVATGYAEEMRGSSNINRTSAMENCETSAIGRCLANAGLGGEAYATADEALRAIEQQQELDNQPQPESDSPITSSAEIQDNISQAINLIGEDKYREWHSRVLANFFGVDSIEKLTTQQMSEFSTMQKTKIGEHKE